MSEVTTSHLPAKIRKAAGDAGTYDAATAQAIRELDLIHEWLSSPEKIGSLPLALAQVGDLRTYLRDVRRRIGAREV